MNIFFEAIIRWSMTHKITVIFLSCIIVVAGLWSLATMKIDVLPDVNKPTVAIFAESEGLASEEVEKLVVNPLELAIAGAPDIEVVRSSSLYGLGLINVQFSWNTDIYRNRQIIQERIAQVNLPSNIRPVLGPTTSVMGEIVWAGMIAENETATPMQLRTLADWTVRPAILKIPGVSNVLIMGGDVKEWQINVDAQKLRRYGLTLKDVMMTVQGSSKNRGGGILNQDDREYPIRILALPSEVKDYESIVIGRAGGGMEGSEGAIVRLGDIARAQELPGIVRGTASIDGKEGVILRIVTQPGAETLKVTKAIDETLLDLSKTLPQGVKVHNDLMRQEWFIHAGLKNVTDALRDGIIILIVILMLFLMNLRITFITLTAIPLSIFATLIIFNLFGFSVNVMTLGGLAVAIGELVDDAIVGVEHVYRKLRESKSNANTEAKDGIIARASSEVRNSIVYATILVAVAFMPIFFIPGVEGRILSPLGLAYIVSLIASMIVSLTVTPVLCSYLLSKSKQILHQGDTRLVAWIKRSMFPLLHWSIDHPKILMIGVALSLAISGALYFSAGKEGIPPFNEQSATVMAILPEGTNLDTTNRFVTQVENNLMRIEGVQRVSHTTGRSAVDSHGGGANSSELQIVFKPGLEMEKKKMFAEIQKVFDRHGGADYSLGQPITHRLEELLSGVRAPIVIKVFGERAADMQRAAEMVRDELKKENGITNPRIAKDIMVPELRIYPLADRLAQYGLSPGMVAEELEEGLMGMPIEYIPHGNERIPLVMRYDYASRGNLRALSDLPLPFEGVESLSGSAADVRVEPGRNRYSHEQTQRVLVVSANYQGGNIIGAIDRVKDRLDDMRLPDGIRLSYEGTYKSQKENSQRLLILFFIGLVLIFSVLYQSFRSIPIVLQIMASIPTVFIGSLIAVYLSGNTISLAHMIGFVSLMGIVSRNGILLISRCITSVTDEGLAFSKETVIRATLDRVTPVLMTSSVTALALVPLLLSPGAPGKEMLSPLAVVIFGGLISSTAISLFLTPSLFYRFGKKRFESISQ